jgi:hypothetical protein
MKKFFFKFIYLTPILLIIISVNYIGDAANLFSINFEKDVAKILLDGYHVANLYNYDERLLQKHLIEQQKSVPDIIVLGSSRVMTIGTKYFSKSFRNHSVSGASLEDDLAIIALYEKKGILPKEIILGLDPWLLNNFHSQNRWEVLREEYSNMLKNIKLSDNLSYSATSATSNKYIQLLSLSYFQTSFKNIGRGTSYYPSKNKTNNETTKLADGSISYDTAYRKPLSEKLKQIGNGYIIEKPIYSLENFTQLSEKYQITLEKFITYLQKKNIKIIFFLAPYEPNFFDYLIKNSDYTMVEESEKYFRNLADKYQIKVLGSLNPKKYELNANYFFDYMHINDKATEIIMKKDWLENK